MKDMLTPSDTVEENGPALHRDLQNRRTQLTALGGAIDTSLFLDIGSVIQVAGPAVLLGYTVAGIVALLTMRQLDEMVVEEPVSGPFIHLAYKYWGPLASFLSGWNHWAMSVLVEMAELITTGTYVQY